MVDVWGGAWGTAWGLSWGGVDTARVITSTDDLQLPTDFVIADEPPPFRPWPVMVVREE